MTWSDGAECCNGTQEPAVWRLSIGQALPPGAFGRTEGLLDAQGGVETTERLLSIFAQAMCALSPSNISETADRIEKQQVLLAHRPG